jgi:hypothetical protein
MVTGRQIGLLLEVARWPAAFPKLMAFQVPGKEEDANEFL